MVTKIRVHKLTAGKTVHPRKYQFESRKGLSVGDTQVKGKAISQQTHKPLNNPISGSASVWLAIGWSSTFWLGIVESVGLVICLRL